MLVLNLELRIAVAQLGRLFRGVDVASQTPQAASLPPERLHLLGND